MYVYVYFSFLRYSFLFDTFETVKNKFLKLFFLNDILRTPSGYYIVINKNNDRAEIRL